MNHTDINSAIVGVLAKHPPIGRKEIHDNLPPGTYGPKWQLRETLDDISKRLDALARKGRTQRSGRDDNGVLLWSVPGAETKAAEPETIKPDDEPAPLVMADEFEPEVPQEMPSDLVELARPISPLSPRVTQAVDELINAIHENMAAISIMPTVRHKAETLEALELAYRLVFIVEPDQGQRLYELIDTVGQLEEVS